MREKSSTCWACMYHRLGPVKSIFHQNANPLGLGHRIGHHPQREHNRYHQVGILKASQIQHEHFHYFLALNIMWQSNAKQSKPPLTRAGGIWLHWVTLALGFTFCLSPPPPPPTVVTQNNHCFWWNMGFRSLLDFF